MPLEFISIHGLHKSLKMDYFLNPTIQEETNDTLVKRQLQLSFRTPTRSIWSYGLPLCKAFKHQTDAFGINNYSGKFLHHHSFHFF